jgi:polyisoprenoid-binding protein YceI
MQAPSGQRIAPVMQTLLKDGAPAGAWVLDPRQSSIRLKTRSMWGLAPVKGVFREISGTGTVCPDGQVSGTGLTWNPMGLVGVTNTLTIHAVFTRR